MNLNDWYQYVRDNYRNSQGDQPFVEFTLDPSGMELAEDTPKSERYFEAPWKISLEDMSEDYMPKYIGVWKYIYHPDLIERARSV